MASYNVNLKREQLKITKGEPAVRTGRSLVVCLAMKLTNIDIPFD